MFKLKYASLLASLALTATPALADDTTLKVYLLAGQSNMQGHGLGYEAFTNAAGSTSMEMIVDNATYRQGLIDGGKHSFAEHIDETWFDARDDVWARHYDSKSRGPHIAEPTIDQSGWSSGIRPLSQGFGIGRQGHYGSFGPELGFGQSLGRAMNSPILLIKSDRGGTQLADGWRPPSAAADRGGSTGVDFTGTVANIKSVLDQLDQDKANGFLDDKYNGATDYEVAGFFWLQGWNEMYDDVDQNTGPTPAQAIAEYEENLVDLVQDLRASDSRIPDDLPVIFMESADDGWTNGPNSTGIGNPELNAARQGAADQLNAIAPDTAVFIDHDLSVGRHGHFSFKAEAYLELGWLAGETAIENGFTGSEVVPEPGTAVGLLLGGAMLFTRRR